MERSSITGYPLRQFVMETLIRLIFEKGGSIRTTDKHIGWDVYDEMANRCQLAEWSRSRGNCGRSDHRPAWRREVGYSRKDLVTDGCIKSTKEGGKGTWTLTEKGLRVARRLSEL